PTRATRACVRHASRSRSAASRLIARASGRAVRRRRRHAACTLLCRLATPKRLGAHMEAHMINPGRLTVALAFLSATTLVTLDVARAAPRKEPFAVEEATITDIQKALTTGRITAVELVGLYLQRIKAYNGTCV